MTEHSIIKLRQLLEGSYAEARGLRKVVRERLYSEFRNVHQFKNMSWSIGKFNKTKKIVGKVQVPSVTADGELTINISIGGIPNPTVASFKVGDYKDAKKCIDVSFKYLKEKMGSSGVEGYLKTDG